MRCDQCKKHGLQFWDIREGRKKTTQFTWARVITADSEEAALEIARKKYANKEPFDFPPIKSEAGVEVA